MVDGFDTEGLNEYEIFQLQMLAQGEIGPTEDNSQWKVLQQKVLFGAPRAFPSNFCFPQDSSKQKIYETKPAAWVNAITIWVGGITYGIQAEFSDGRKSPKYGQEGGLPMRLEIPEDTDFRKIVVEFSRVEKFCRSIVLYGADDDIIRKVEVSQDDEDPESRYYTIEFDKGDKIYGIYGHQAMELFINGCIHCFGFFIARPIDVSAPHKTRNLSIDELQSKPNMFEGPTQQVNGPRISTNPAAEASASYYNRRPEVSAAAQGDEPQGDEDLYAPQNMDEPQNQM